jgi:thioredoxin reductase (NADPH)
MGPDLMSEMKAQAERFGTRFIIGDVERVELGERPFRIHGSGLDDFVVTCDALIISTGAKPRRIGLESESRLWGTRGVTACATCDGHFYKEQDVVVVGGGDTAMEEAIYLTKMCRQVTLIHRRDEFRASKIMVKRARENPKIKWETPMVVDDILVDEKDFVRGVRLSHAQSGETHEIAARGFFVAIGHEPNTHLFKGQLDLDENGYLLVGRGTATSTSVKGVFAAGDVADHVYRQAVTAAGTGCQAAIDAERYLAHHE